MRKAWPLLALGVAAFVAFALATLPANVVLARLQPPGVTLAGVSGTIWNGHAQALRSGTTHLGSLQWRLQVLPLLAGKLRADARVARVDGFVQTTLDVGTSGRLTLRDLAASLPLSALPPNIVPRGWSGMLNFKFERLVLENDWPVAAVGTLDLIDVASPASGPVQIGSYRIAFPAEGTQAAAALSGKLADLDGLLLLSGTLRLAAQRSYAVEGLVAPRPNAPAEVTKMIEFLGAPDAQGRRPFGFSGTL